MLTQSRGVAPSAFGTHGSQKDDISAVALTICTVFVSVLMRRRCLSTYLGKITAYSGHRSV